MFTGQRVNICPVLPCLCNDVSSSNYLAGCPPSLPTPPPPPPSPPSLNLPALPSSGVPYPPPSRQDCVVGRLYGLQGWGGVGWGARGLLTSLLQSHACRHKGYALCMNFFYLYFFLLTQTKRLQTVPLIGRSASEPNRYFHPSDSHASLPLRNRRTRTPSPSAEAGARSFVRADRAARRGGRGRA